MLSKSVPHNPVGHVVAAHPSFVRLARAGWLAKGVVYVLAGVLALVIVARSFGWTTTDASSEASPTGAIAELARRGAGPILLWALAVGMMVYAAWRLASAVLPGATDAKGWATRAGYLVSAVLYTTLGVTAISLARAPTTTTDGNQTVRDTTSSLMGHTAGRGLVGAVGVIVVAAGLYHVIAGLRSDVTRDIDTSRMSASRRRWTRRLGAVGEFGRGIGIGLIGVFLVRAAITYDAAEATGLDGALRRLAVNRPGVALVAIVGIGFVAYGIFCVLTFPRRQLQAP